jgi:hypothetical protein
MSERRPGAVKRGVNAVLSRTTGYQLTKAGVAQRAPKPVLAADRLVSSPVFLLSSVRSGSTLLRVILDTHSQIHAPHELHLRVMRVHIEAGYGELAVKELGLDEQRLEYMLWDRLLSRLLAESGKRIIVDKTPNNVFMWERLPQAWPKARFIFLLRHPAAIADSLYRATKNPVMDKSIARVLEYATALEAARQNLPGLTVKYEDFVADPAAVTAEMCSFLGVPWEPGMLDYGSVDHGRYVNRLGDWSPKIRSGEIHRDVAVPADADVPAELVDISRAWGYLSS